jgi:hypothetical protein
LLLVRMASKLNNGHLQIRRRYYPQAHSRRCSPGFR